MANLLYLVHRIPYPPNKGDKVRSYHILKHLAARHRVFLGTFADDPDDLQHVTRLRELCAELRVIELSPRLARLRSVSGFAANEPLSVAYYRNAELARWVDSTLANEAIDACIVFSSAMAQYVAGADAPRTVLIDFVDVDSAKWRDFAASARPPMRWLYQREARLLAAFEAAAAERARAATVVNEREQRALEAIAPRGNIHVLPNGVDADHLHPDGPPSVEQRVIFPAVFNYRPNSDGAIWLAREVWPLVTTLLPNARLTLAGASPTGAVRALARRDKTIEVTGAVPDMRPYLWRSAVAVAPLFLARGVQNKVLEAAAAGLPCVVTPAVRNGLPPEVLPACQTADTPVEFANAIIQLLLLSPSARRRVARSAMLSPLSWNTRLASLDELLYDAQIGALAAGA